MKKISFSPQRQFLSFTGSCDDVLDTCRAMCCRSWDISLHAEEYRSGMYKAEVYCTATKGTCNRPKAKCVQQGFRLKKQVGGACGYLAQDNRCTIYGYRPLVCRNFSCEQGWRLVPASKGERSSVRQYSFSSQSLCYTREPSLNDVLIRNPLVVREKISYDAKERACTIIARTVTSCHRDTLLFLDSNNMIHNVLKRLSRNGPLRVSLRGLYESLRKSKSIRCTKRELLLAVTFLLESDVLHVWNGGK